MLLFDMSKFAFLRKLLALAREKVKANFEHAQEPEHAPDFSPRVLDTLNGNQIDVFLFILNIIDHPTYNKIFGYRKR